MTKKKRVLGQPSWTLRSRDVEAHVTELGGHLGPVTFDRRRRKIRPFSVAPWAEEKVKGVPPLLESLRGDFFCAPFGGNSEPWRGEVHPPHGETANGVWRLESQAEGMLHLSLKTRVRRGRVDKRIFLEPGHNVIYQQHVLSGMSGPMSVGHHAMLKFSGQDAGGQLSTSPFALGQVLPVPFENPVEGGYQSLKPGATFKDLSKVPLQCGGTTDVSVYPAREGYEDLVMLAAAKDLPLAWNAVFFPKERFVYFALRDPRVLRSTILWLSNGGRHYPPWSGRHRAILGMEDVTGNFHLGLAPSAGANPISRRGIPTVLKMDPRRPTVVNYLFGVVPVPSNFGAVSSLGVMRDLRSIVLEGARGKRVTAAVDVAFLWAPQIT